MIAAAQYLGSLFCEAYGEWVDARDLDEVFSHHDDHRPHPDIPYRSAERVGEGEE
jgi:hypothetical protein